MAMIFKQFMINFCCEMYIKFNINNFILLFLVVPCLCTTENTRNRRRPNLETTNIQDDADTKLKDQIAVATNYNSHTRIDTPYQLSYEEELALKSHNVGNGNYRDAETPEQYVTNALKSRMQNIGAGGGGGENSDKNTIPDSTLGKYEVYEGFETHTAEPLIQKAYHKESVTRASYDLYDYDDNDDSISNNNEYRKPSSSSNAFSYSTFRYEPQQYSPTASSSISNENNYPHSYDYRHPEDTSSSPLSEIPKDEILKQIEESVVKYMKNLEAEGKLPIKEPIREPPKTYYKAPSSIDFGKSYTSVYKTKDIGTPQVEHTQRVQYTKPTAVRAAYKEPKYQPEDDVVDPQNIEFVYKMKSRSPHASASQKSPLTFDHAAALKNLEGFDLSHAVHHSEENKPTRPKLYLNSETYHDINSLPYKSEKRPSEHKEKDKHRGYSALDINDSSNLRHASDVGGYSGKGTEDGYPLMNPYKYYLNAQALLSKYAETNLTPQPSDWQGYLTKKQSSNSQIYSPSYDIYNPKFNNNNNNNNNPEGYGAYQHNYKLSEPLGVQHPTRSPHHQRSPTKRGKRGGGSNGNNGGHKKSVGRTISKDQESNIVLRPPPSYKD